jgi:hypothetical protein
MSKLLDFIITRHKELDISTEGTYDLLGTRTRFKMIMKTFPETASLLDIIRLAQRVQVHPLTLINEYGMGDRSLTQKDKDQLGLHYAVLPLHPTPKHNAIPSSPPENAG